MSETKLKPCPFCGGEAEAKKEIGGSCWKVKCKQCSCEVGRYWFHNKNHAIIAWNTRKPMDNIVEQLEEELENANIMWDNGEFYRGVANGVGYAIDTVKRGGVNE